MSESWLDKQVREAQERGDFDNLPGAGKPLPDRGELHDPDWWLKQFVAREGASASALPPSLQLRKEIEDVPLTLRRLPSAEAVSAYLASLNERVEAARRGPIDGPRVEFDPVDVRQALLDWHRQRQASQT